MGDPLQPLTQGLWNITFKCMFFGTLAALAGLAVKMFENWSVRSIRNWRKQRGQKQRGAKFEGMTQDEVLDAPHCPNCGGLMVLRTARKGENAGAKFWGCPSFPK